MTHTFPPVYGKHQPHPTQKTDDMGFWISIILLAEFGTSHILFTHSADSSYPKSLREWAVGTKSERPHLSQRKLPLPDVGLTSVRLTWTLYSHPARSQRGFKLRCNSYCLGHSSSTGKARNLSFFNITRGNVRTLIPTYWGYFADSPPRGGGLDGLFTHEELPALEAKRVNRARRELLIELGGGSGYEKAYVDAAKLLGLDVVMESEVAA